MSRDEIDELFVAHRKRDAIALALAGGMSLEDALRHYERWRSTRYRRSKGMRPQSAMRRAMPDDFPQLAAQHTTGYLITHYAESREKIAEWRKECGVRSPWMTRQTSVRPKPRPRTGGFGLEQRFHALFADTHQRREWFAASDKLSAVIAAINDGSFDVATLPSGKRLARKDADRSYMTEGWKYARSVQSRVDNLRHKLPEHLRSTVPYGSQLASGLDKLSGHSLAVAKEALEARIEKIGSLRTMPERRRRADRPSETQAAA